jgi:hypothetical protein
VTTQARACRSCGAQVYDLRNVGTGNLAPVDVAVVPDGTIRIDLEAGTYRIVGRDFRAGMESADRHKSHFATCPQAASWRSKLPPR